MNIPFHKPLVPSDKIDIFSDSIKSGWLTTGPLVKKFEQLLSDFTGADFVIAVNSCTAALHLALAAKGFGKGDKFIVPTFTFVASVEVGEYLGMEPILIDCDSNYNIDIKMVKNVISTEKNVKAIIPVHFAGKPVNMKQIVKIANDYNLFIIEDAAHALESQSNIGKVGNTKHATAFSFYANKNITTAGEGGALTTNNSNLAEKIRKLSLHGMSKDGWKRFSSKGKWDYDVSELGYKYNLTDVAASFGIHQFSFIQKWHLKRKNIFNLYHSAFKNIDGIICPDYCQNNEKHAFHLFVIRIVDQKWIINRDEIIQKLNERGIGTSVHYKPVHMHTYYQKKYNFRNDDFPNSTIFFNNVLTLPLYPLLKLSEVDYIINVVNNLWINFRK